MSYKLYASAFVLVPLITETYKKSKLKSPINKKVEAINDLPHVSLSEKMQVRVPFYKQRTTNSHFNNYISKNY